MPAHAGKFPGDFYKPVDYETKTGRQRATVRANGLEWDLSTGWHAPRQKGWKRDPLRPATKQIVTGLDGKQHKVTFYGDFDDNDNLVSYYSDHVGFRPNTSVDYDERMKFAEEAFNGDDPANNIIVKDMPDGHISKLEFERKHQTLRVTFENGDVCIFFTIPDQVAGELLALADPSKIAGYHRYGSKRGQERHLLGVRFWDLVRIRGQRHGARYPFEYEHKASRRVHVSKGSGRRVFEMPRDSVAREKILRVLPARYKSMFAENLDLAETAQVVLTEEEWNAVASTLSNDTWFGKDPAKKEYTDEEKSQFAKDMANARARKAGNKVVNASSLNKEDDEGKTIDFWETISNEDAARASEDAKANIDRYSWAIENWRELVNQKIKNLKEDPIFNSYVSSALAKNENVFEGRADWEALKAYRPDFLEGVRFNAAEDKIEPLYPENRRQAMALARAAEGPGAFKREFGSSEVLPSLKWTKDMLMRKAELIDKSGRDKGVGEAIRHRIRYKDLQGALNTLIDNGYASAGDMLAD